MFEEDYIMRLIHEIVRTILKLLFHIEEDKEEILISDEKTKEKMDDLLKLVKQKNINEAENLLLDELDTNNLEELKMGLFFYRQINKFSEEELEEAGFSREEIRMGIEGILSEFGYSGFTDMF